MAQVEVLAASFAFAEVLEGDCYSAEGAEHEEKGGWGGLLVSAWGWRRVIEGRMYCLR